jgi:hypothetical protein
MPAPAPRPAAPDDEDGDAPPQEAASTARKIDARFMRGVDDETGFARAPLDDAPVDRAAPCSNRRDL